MTLVVAKILNEDVQILSDTKITDIYLGSQNPLSGQLKTILLNPYISISFSGLPDYATEVLQAFYERQLPHIDSFGVINPLIFKCLEINRKSNNNTNFILCFVYQNQPKIYKISNYQVEQNLQTAWIGDISGFNKYQEYYHSSSKLKEFDKMEDAFDKVVDNESIKTVGDFTIRVRNELDRSGKIQALSYQTNRLHYNGPYDFVNVGDGRFMMKHTTSEMGGYGYSLFRSFNLQTPAIGFHFHVGKFGLLFFPQQFYTNGIIIPNQSDGETFANEVKKQFGFDVQGLLIAEKGLAFKHINTSKE